MRKRVYDLLDHRMSGMVFASEDGAVRLSGVPGPASVSHDSEEYPEAVYDYCPYQLTSRHAEIR